MLEKDNNVTKHCLNVSSIQTSKVTLICFKDNFNIDSGKLICFKDNFNIDSGKFFLHMS
jgi:hypothetical protein